MTRHDHDREVSVSEAVLVLVDARPVGRESHGLAELVRHPGVEDHAVLFGGLVEPFVLRMACRAAGRLRRRRRLRRYPAQCGRGGESRYEGASEHAPIVARRPNGSGISTLERVQLPLAAVSFSTASLQRDDQCHTGARDDPGHDRKERRRVCESRIPVKRHSDGRRAQDDRR
jgi:hypothetical protein